MAQDQVKLFKVISPKDDVTIGLTTTELKGFGTAADLDNLAHHLAADGQMTVWQYAVLHGKDGSLEISSSHFSFPSLLSGFPSPA